MYNPQNAKEIEGLPKDSILDGAIIEIKDGKVSDFITKEETRNEWKGNINQPAINVTVEVMHNNNSVKLGQIFTYIDNDGITEYPMNSNIGKFKLKYGGLPTLGKQVKVTTNDKGFGKIKLD